MKLTKIAPNFFQTADASVSIFDATGTDGAKTWFFEVNGRCPHVDGFATKADAIKAAKKANRAN